MRRTGIEKMVYDKYPTTKKERQGCQQEKQRMEALRREYRKRLMDQQGKEKREYE